MRVAVIIPTLRRPDFVLRQVAYYSNSSSKVAVYIGDSSGPAEADRLARGLALLPELRCLHLRCEGLDERGAIVRLLSSVEEPFCALSGDDDFLVPRALHAAAEFLESHPEYRTAQGRGFVFSLATDLVNGPIAELMEYWGRPHIEDLTGSQRIDHLAGRYWVPLFSVHRTQEFLEDWRPFEFIPDRQFGELGPCFVSIACGKSKFLDVLHVARQVHAGRYLESPGLAWTNSSKWGEAYQIMESALTSALMQADGLASEAARKRFRSSFDKYLAHSLRKAPVAKTVAALVRAKARAIVASLSPSTFLAVKKLRRGFDQDDAMSLTTLTSDRSPYRTDFVELRAAIEGNCPVRP